MTELSHRPSRRKPEGSPEMSPVPQAACDGLEVICTERYGSGLSHRYLKESNGSLVCDQRPTDNSYRSLRDCFVSLFLPHGYPDSVSKDYLSYQLWDTVQAFASSVTGSLATHSLLRGSGVGDGTATVTAATITWILRDGTGMVGRILFAWMKGSRLDCDAKRWRLFADVLNDVAIFLEIVAPVYPSIFTLIVCSAGVFKCIVGVAGGATRAALTVHQAKRDNMADVCAKDGSQETLVNLAGLIVSLFLVPLVSDCLWVTYILFVFLTALHLYANYRAVRSIVMETLNQSRLSIVLDHYLDNGNILDPEAANVREPLLPGLGSQAAVTLGVPLRSLFSSVSQMEMLKKNNHSLYLLGWRKDTVLVVSHLPTFPRRSYLSYLAPLFYDRKSIEKIERVMQFLQCRSNIVEGGLAVVLHDQASSVDMIRASVQAEILHKRASSTDPNCFDILAETHCQLNQMFSQFLKGLTAAGWVTDRNLLDSDDWRANWDVKKQK